MLTLFTAVRDISPPAFISEPAIVISFPLSISRFPLTFIVEALCVIFSVLSSTLSYCPLARVTDALPWSYSIADTGQITSLARVLKSRPPDTSS